MHHFSHRTVATECNCARVRAKHIFYVAIAALFLVGVQLRKMDVVYLDSTNLREESSSDDPKMNGSTEVPTVGSTGVPTINVSIGDPSTNGSTGVPSVNSSIGDPTINDSIRDPSTNGSTGVPTVNDSIGDPSTNGSTVVPSANSSIGDPTINDSIRDPSTNGSTGVPTVNDSIGDPSTNGSTGVPSVNSSIGDPTINSGIGDADPSTNASTGVPKVNSSIGDPSINGSIGDPTFNGTIGDDLGTNFSSNDYEFYTFAPRPPSRREQFLFYTELGDYLSRVDRFYYDFIEAARTHPSLDVFVFGPGFTGWDKNLSATENINNRFNNTHMSVVYAHYRHPGEYSRGLMMHELGDCDGEYCRAHMNPFANVVIFRYAHEAVDMFANSVDGSRYPRFAKPQDPHLIAHVPDCANAKVFFPPKDMSRRSNAIVVYGATGGINPLRVKVAGYIWEGKIPGGVRFYHPGYDQLGIIKRLEAEGKLNLSDARLDPYLDTEQNRVLQNILSKSQREMAQHMRETWICVFDSTTMRKTIRKFMEAMLSGCAVASDIPLDFPLEYSHLIIELKHQWSVERINATLQAHLSDKPALMKRIDSGLKFARKTYPCAKKVDAVLEVADGCRYRNWGGFVFPHSFRVDCTLYDQTPEFHQLHPWCNDTAAIAAGGHRLL